MLEVVLKGPCVADDLVHGDMNFSQEHIISSDDNLYKGNWILFLSCSNIYLFEIFLLGECFNGENFHVFSATDTKLLTAVV